MRKEQYNLEYLQRHRTSRSPPDRLKVDMGVVQETYHSSYILSSRITSMDVREHIEEQQNYTPQPATAIHVVS